MARKNPFRTDNRPTALVEAQRAKIQKVGDWWFAHSYCVWVFFGVVWVGMTYIAATGHTPKLAWVCGMVAFLQLFRGWEIYKHQKVIEKLTAQRKNDTEGF